MKRWIGRFTSVFLYSIAFSLMNEQVWWQELTIGLLFAFGGMITTYLHFNDKEEL